MEKDLEGTDQRRITRSMPPVASKLPLAVKDIALTPLRILMKLSAGFSSRLNLLLVGREFRKVK